MATILTKHVRRFGELIPSEGVLNEVRRLLRRQMRRRGLLGWPPVMLGYPDVRRWSDEGAFDDIISDCYIDAIAQRIVSLQNQLGQNERIDALISHNINHFLTERQREHNPIGYAVYQNVKAATRLAVQDGWLQLERHRGRSLTNAVLRFSEHMGRPILGREDLAEEVVRESDLHEISSRLASCCAAAQDWVVGFLDHLRSRKPDAIRFGDLVAILERLARDAWVMAAPPPSDAVAERDADGVRQLIRIIQADTSLEDREHADRLAVRIRESIEQAPQQERIRRRRLRVFDEIVRHLRDQPDQPIRQADIAQALGINQVTLHHDVEAIRNVVSRLIGGNN